MANNEEEFSYVVSAPGKVILFGEHSVVYRKAAVSTSIGRRLHVMFSTVQENNIFVKFPQINTEIICNREKFEQIVKEKCPLMNLKTVFTLDKPEIIDHDEYIKSLKTNLESLGISNDGSQEKTSAALIGFLYVMRGMCHTLKCDLVPFSIEVKSDLEIGAGTGSSAAFAVAIAGTVYQFRKHLEVNKTVSSWPNINDCVIIKSHQQKSGFSIDELKIINKWAFCIEKIMHGRPSGIDNTTCTFGSVVVTSQEQNGVELIFRFLENVPKISILLISTGVSRNTSNLVAKVRQLRDRNCGAVDAILNAMDVIAQEASKTLVSLGVKSCNATTRIELYRVLCELMELNHGLLRTLGVSHESLERIVSVSCRHGLTSKLTGAGGGGYAITLLPPNFSTSQIEELKNELGPAFKVTEINIAEDGIRLEKFLK